MLWLPPVVYWWWGHVYDCDEVYVNTRRIMQKFLLQGSVRVVRYIIVSSSRVCGIYIHEVLKLLTWVTNSQELWTLHCSRFDNNVGVLPACIMLADLRLERRTAVAVWLLKHSTCRLVLGVWRLYILVVVTHERIHEGHQHGVCRIMRVCNTFEGCWVGFYIYWQLVWLCCDAMSEIRLCELHRRMRIMCVYSELDITYCDASCVRSA